MPKIVIIDTYYPDFIDSMTPVVESLGYEAKLRAVLNYGFGTADFYSHALAAEGWEATDIIANYKDLQCQWLREWMGREVYATPTTIVLDQIQIANPDIVFMQDLSFFDAPTLRAIASRYLLVGQCSCPMPAADRIKQFAILFTSFPHYVEKFRALGVQAEYLPLAFDPRMIPSETTRDLDISFVGGVGRNSHWRIGTDILESVADEFTDRFHWYGYGVDRLGPNSPLRACWRGDAWGRKQYEVYGRSKCVVNRHGEVAAGYSNNLRMFEATGCGAMLLTEESKNLNEIFLPNAAVAYSGPADLCEKLDHYLDSDDARKAIADKGQDWTLSNHTYAQRRRTVSAVLSERLVSA